MQLAEAKDKYIEAWGRLGTSWGVNRTMAQIHALLLVATEPLSTETIMAELKISRGNANMNIRALMDWGLASKVLKPGERREYFISEKEMWDIAKIIARERMKRELEPMVEVLEELKNVEGSDPKTKEFKKVTKNLLTFSKDAQSVLNKFIKSNQNWFFKMIMRLKA